MSLSENVIDAEVHSKSSDLLPSYRTNKKAIDKQFVISGLNEYYVLGLNFIEV